MVMNDQGKPSNSGFWLPASKSISSLVTKAEQHLNPVSNSNNDLSICEFLHINQKSQPNQKIQTTFSTSTKKDCILSNNNNTIFGTITPPFSPIDIDFLSKSFHTSNSLSAQFNQNQSACDCCINEQQNYIDFCHYSTENEFYVHSKNQLQCSPLIKSEMSSNSTSSVASTVTPTILNTNGGGSAIPVGIAIARQRINQSIESQSNQNILTCASYQTKNSTSARFYDLAPNLIAADTTTILPGVIGGTLLSSGDVRNNNALIPWMNTGTTFNATATNPAVWHYPSAFTNTTTLDHMLTMPIQVPPIGYQLIRDPSSGQFILLPAGQMQQAFLWPNYAQSSSSHVLIPPVPQTHQPQSLIPISASIQPLQIINSADYLSTSTTLHQQTQSTRLVALSTDTKQRITIPTHALLKLEPSDHANQYQDQNSLIVQSSAITSKLCSQNIECNYQNGDKESSFKIEETNNNHIETIIRDGKESPKATSSVPCLTPPPENSNLEKLNTNEEERTHKESKPDLSNLELLSNSIMDYVYHGKSEKLVNDNVTSDNKQKTDVEEKPVTADVTTRSSSSINENIGGLNLLCVLAEEMYQKEVKIQENAAKSKINDVDNCCMDEDDKKDECESKLSQKFDSKLDQKSVKQLTKLLDKSSENQNISQNEKSIDFKACLISLQERYKSKQNIFNHKVKKYKNPSNSLKRNWCNSNEEETDSSSSKKSKVDGSMIISASNKFKHKLAKQDVNRYCNNNLDTSEDDNNYKKHRKEDECKKSQKFRPKLKAEPQLKSYFEDDEVTDSKNCYYYHHPVLKHPSNDDNNNIPSIDYASKCILKESDLLLKNLRVIAVHSNRLCSGTLNVTQLPDIYEFFLDDKRANKPLHVTKEEVFKNMMLELRPRSVSQLVSGCRICARWSSQKSDFYPGTVTETTDNSDPSNEVAIQFDDGDLRTINIDFIRYLDPNISLNAYDQSPLTTLSRRKKRHNSNHSFKVDKKSKNEKKVCNESISKFNFEETYKIIDQSNNVATSSHIPQEHEVIGSDDEKYEMARMKSRKHKRKHKISSSSTTSNGSEGKKHKKRKHHHHHHHRSRHEKQEANTEIASTSTGICSQQLSKDDNKKKHLDSSDSDDVPEITSRSESFEDEKQHSREEQISSLESKSISENNECPLNSDLVKKALLQRKWSWVGPGSPVKRSSKIKYDAVENDSERIKVGDCIVLISEGFLEKNPSKPYVGEIEELYQFQGHMKVRTRWFYHPSETRDKSIMNLVVSNGALFKSKHGDNNEVQTISHKCRVVSYSEFQTIPNISRQVKRHKIFYLAGTYDTHTKTNSFEDDVPLRSAIQN